MKDNIVDLTGVVHEAIKEWCERHNYYVPEGPLYDEALDNLVSGVINNCKMECLKDYTDEEYAEYSWEQICNDVREQFDLKDADAIAIKVVRYIGEEERGTEHNIIRSDDLCSTLNDILESTDFKNGCQLYEDHFQITGGAWFDEKTGTPVGFSYVKVYLKEYVW